MRKPSIHFIQTDSQDGRLLGCLGHPALHAATPNGVTAPSSRAAACHRSES